MKFRPPAIGIVECVYGKVLFAEPSLVEKRSEGEHGIVAATERLDVINTGEKTGDGLIMTCIACFFGLNGRSSGWVVLKGFFYSLFQ
jgi:hypothetical protein